MKIYLSGALALFVVIVSACSIGQGHPPRDFKGPVYSQAELEADGQRVQDQQDHLAKVGLEFTTSESGALQWDRAALEKFASEKPETTAQVHIDALTTYTDVTQDYLNKYHLFGIGDDVFELQDASQFARKLDLCRAKLSKIKDFGKHKIIVSVHPTYRMKDYSLAARGITEIQTSLKKRGIEIEARSDGEKSKVRWKAEKDISDTDEVISLLHELRKKNQEWLDQFGTLPINLIQKNEQLTQIDLEEAKKIDLDGAIVVANRTIDVTGEIESYLKATSDNSLK